MSVYFIFDLDRVYEIIHFANFFMGNSIKPKKEKRKKNTPGNNLILFETAKTNNEMLCNETAFFRTLYVFGSMKWWQNHFDVITILIIWRQDYRKG